MYVTYLLDLATLLTFYKAYRRVSEIWRGRRKYRVNEERLIPILL
jgi:hypothetical protein